MKIKNIFGRILYLRKECSEIVGFDSSKTNKFYLLARDEKGNIARNLSDFETTISLFVLKKIHFLYRLFKGYF